MDMPTTYVSCLLKRRNHRAMGPKNQIIYSKINDMLVFEHTYVGTWRSLTQPMNKYNNDINVNEIM
jgi:hypothetical protein